VRYVNEAKGDPTKRFTGRADEYAKYRPRYPKALFDHLFSIGVLKQGCVVADVGSGTGLFSEPLLERGLVVYGVEPNHEMRRQAEAGLARFPNFISVDGRAENTTLPDESVDLVVAAQAYHWFDLDRAREEFRRILRECGHVCIVYNERTETASPLAQEYEALFEAYSKKDKENRERDRDPRELFADEGCMVFEFTNQQELDLEGILGRTFSVSYMPLKGEDGYDRVVEEVTSVFRRHERDGKVAIRYRTQCYCGTFGRDSLPKAN
jgi:SAM-dependent methyltransferase